MADRHTWMIISRFFFFALMILQSFSLSAYPATYKDNSSWYSTFILFLPAILGMWWWMNAAESETVSAEDFYLMMIFWALYIWLGLVPMTAVVFGLTGDKIGLRSFWNPSTLRMTLCITPLLWLLGCRSVEIPLSRELLDSRHGVTRFSVKGMIHLYDAIDILGSVLPNEYGCNGISTDLKNSLLAFACLKNLWFPFVMMIELKRERVRRCDHFVWLVYFIIQLVFEAIFLGFRLGLCLVYYITASIFISKNMLMIIVYVREMLSFCYGKEEEDCSTYQQDTNIRNQTPSAPVQEDTNVCPPHVGFRSAVVAPAPTDVPPPYTP